ncbi:MAG: hypothetical protein RSE41_07660 [Clostridia bacterium]
MIILVYLINKIIIYNINIVYYYLPHDLNKPIQISNNLKNFIKEKESLDLRAHYVKINKKGKIGREDFLTIGWGHKLPKNTKLKQGDKITLEQAQKFFDDDINNIVGKGLMMRLRELKEAGVEIEKIPQHVIDIMGDIIYNGGSSGLRNTDFFKTLMLGDFYKAGKLLPKTQITAKGHVQPGLVKRAKERELQYFKNFNKELNMWVKP